MRRQNGVPLVIVVVACLAVYYLCLVTLELAVDKYAACRADGGGVEFCIIGDGS